MLDISVVCFVLAAMLGMILISYILRNKSTPKGLAFIHGPIAAIGIVLLIIYSVMHYERAPVVSVLLFVIAAILGFLLIFRDITGKSIPKSLAIFHALFALAGFGFLILFIT